jgi:hypothetical protein
MGFDLTGASGNYFRANVWSWRPIHEMVKRLNEEQGLKLDLEHWGTNDGAGLNTQEECDKLARALEAHVQGGEANFVYDSPYDVRVDEQGRFLVGSSAKGGKSAYHTDAEHVLEFVKFLRECGGSFEIW